MLCVAVLVCEISSYLFDTQAGFLMLPGERGGLTAPREHSGPLLVSPGNRNRPSPKELWGRSPNEAAETIRYLPLSVSVYRVGSAFASSRMDLVWALHGLAVSDAVSSPGSRGASLTGKSSSCPDEEGSRLR